MRKYLLLLSLIAVFFSCSSDDSNPITVNEVCEISNAIYSSNENFSFEYNGNEVVSLTSNNRVVNVSYDSGNNIEKYEINEVGNSEVIFRKEFDFDDNSNLIEVRTYDFYIDELIPVTKFVYDYENGKVIRISQYDLETNDYEGKTEFEWSNHNVVSSSFYDEGDILECTTTYSFNSTMSQFYDNYKEFYLLNLNDDDFDEALLLSYNLLASATNGCSSATTNYAYSFNNENLISTINKGGSLYLALDYDCN